jgi:hypothetical protein
MLRQQTDWAEPVEALPFFFNNAPKKVSPSTGSGQTEFI